jgi:hypothetical protein
MQRTIKHRSICRLIDFEIDSRPSEKHVFLLTEAYNTSLGDLYFTSKHENVEFTEE